MLRRGGTDWTSSPWPVAQPDNRSQLCAVLSRLPYKCAVQARPCLRSRLASSEAVAARCPENTVKIAAMILASGFLGAEGVGEVVGEVVG